MKIKSSLLALSLFCAGSVSSNGAIFLISNVLDFTTDTLYADANNVPMSSGIVTIGYFGSSIVDEDIDTVSELLAQLSGFTIESSAVPGAVMGTFGIGANGYADNADLSASMGTISSSSALIGRSIYSIITDASSLASATSSNLFAVVKIGTISADELGDNTYTSNPAGLTPIIGSNDTFTGDLGLDFDGPGGEPGLGTQTYTTLKLVPEPTTTLLGAIGALALLRRRRN